ncbi:MAG: FKBP-type peptidyl-prolyl cis-trans isomerase [Fimbriimonadaceae bacterium]
MNLKVGIGCAMLLAALAGCSNNHTAVAGGGTSTSTTKLAKLVIKDIKVGTGPEAEVGDTAVMEYTGTLADHTVFDSNAASANSAAKPPFAFQLVKDHANVIEGWNRGILGMKVGGERKLSIPWRLAYGEAGKAPIPPKADLYFDVKLLWLVKAGHEGDYGVTDLKPGTGPVVKAGDWVTITYKATLLNGIAVDDSSSLPNGTLQFQAHTGAIDSVNYVPMKGVVEGVVGMRQGGERLLTCPPLLASNPMTRNEKLVPNSVVRFDVKMLRVLGKPGAPMDAPK